ncbi:hypothetical protein EGI22_00805 [Lacihabitans sp. LS3-19]|nr:hypothetical protein [Lacihabitans sp. LS3-19]
MIIYYKLRLVCLSLVILPFQGLIFMLDISYSQANWPKVLLWLFQGLPLIMYISYTQVGWPKFRNFRLFSA